MIRSRPLLSVQDKRKLEVLHGRQSQEGDAQHVEIRRLFVVASRATKHRQSTVSQRAEQNKRIGEAGANCDAARGSHRLRADECQPASLSRNI